MGAGRSARAAGIASSIVSASASAVAATVPPPSAAVVAELECDAEVLFPQEANRLLKVVLRRRRHAHLIRLDGRLDPFQLVVLDELDDVLGRFGRNALLERDDAPDRVVRGPF